MRCLILSSYPEFHAVLAIGLFVLPEWKGRVLSAKHYPGFGDTACPKGGVLGLEELEGWHQSLLQRCLAPYEGRGPHLVTPRALRWISKPCPRARRFQVFSGSKQRLAGGCPLSPVPCPPGLSPSLPRPVPPLRVPGRLRGSPPREVPRAAPTARPLSGSAAMRPARLWGGSGDSDAAPWGPPWLCHARGRGGAAQLPPVLRRAPRDSAASPRPLLGLGKPRTARPSVNKSTPAPRLKQGTPPGVLFRELGGCHLPGSPRKCPGARPSGRLRRSSAVAGPPPGAPPAALSALPAP